MQRRGFYRQLRMARISVEELQSLRNAGGDPLVIDVRNDVGFEAEPRRIPGALPCVMERIDSVLADIPRDREIILYCT